MKRLRGAFPLRVSEDPDHEPRFSVFESLFPNQRAGPGYRDAARLDQINYDVAIITPQYSRREFDDARECGRITNRSNPLRTVPAVRPEMLGSSERRCQRLEHLFQTDAAMALRVKFAIEMIANVRVPTSIASRHHDEIFPCSRTSHPQC